MSRTAARIVAEVLNTKPNAVLGMATGSTPLGLYQELVRLHQKEQLDFSRVTTFNLDEYVGLTVNHPQRYHYFMHEHFFRHVNVPAQNINIPSGTTSNYPAFCEWYEKRIAECGGIDIQILGIGSDGHIAFNAPGSSLTSRHRSRRMVVRQRRRVVVGAVRGAALLALWGPVQAQQPLSELFRKVSPSVVLVRTLERSVTADPQAGLTTIPGLGSGVLISADGKVMTAAHVVQTADRVAGQFLDGKLYPAA